MAANLSHESFTQPEDPDIRIWRYMDLPRFVSLLATRSLYLCRIGVLPDAYEGKLPARISKLLAEQELELARKREVAGMPSPPPREDLGGVMSKLVRAMVFVNCWCKQEHESEALWRIYGHPTGVAITTRYSRLAASLPNDHFLGCVRYIDYEDGEVSPNNIFNLAMHKRSFFSHENEVRIVWPDFSAASKVIVEGPEGPNWKAGVTVPFEPNEVVDRIRVSPYAAPWFFDCVRMLVERFGCTTEVAWSRMRE